MASNSDKIAFYKKMVEALLPFNAAWSYEIQGYCNDRIWELEKQEKQVAND